MHSPFKLIPERFFSPLASKNREHYAHALLVFYESFLASPVGVERDGFIDKLERYCDSVGAIEVEDEPGGTGEADEPLSGARGMAYQLLKKITNAGWVSEEMMHDFSRVLNLCSYAKPYFEALYFTATGGGTEYESHIVAVYSLMCSDALRDNGHYTVLRAHDHVMKLLESLKVLSQNIKTHHELLYRDHDEISDILHAHYTVYMEEVIDRAYNRLKTSDNLSRYRPEIIAKVNDCLENDEWLDATAARLAILRKRSGMTPRQDLRCMLEELRDSLRDMDRVIDDIDRRNRLYSRISTHKIKNKLYADSSIGGKLVALAGALHREELDHEALMHGVFRLRSISSESCYARFKGDKAEAAVAPPVLLDAAKLDQIEHNLRKRIALQMNAAKVASYLDARCGEGVTDARTLVSTRDDYVKIMYAAIYESAQSKKFPFGIEWRKGEKSTSAGAFSFPAHEFYRRKKEKTDD